MGVPASPKARAAVLHAVEALISSGATSSTPPLLFEAANDAAWEMGIVLSKADAWTAVYEWAGFTNDSPPPDETDIGLDGQTRDG